MRRHVTVETYDAFGGPEFPRMGEDGFPKGPTDAGEYRVAYVGRHASKRYPTWSKIPWGTPLKDEGGELFVKMGPKWQRLGDVVPLTRADVEKYHATLYQERRVPRTWVFNDFGHATCFLYEDTNRNRRRDKSERIHGEFIHTTPDDEASTARNLPFELGESHGCIHVRPLDIDEMIRRGFMRKNTKVVVHPYSVRKTVLPARERAIGPFELHFFPAMQKLAVIGRAR